MPFAADSRDTGFVPNGVGETAADVAEELGFEQRFRKPGAIDRRHRREPPPAGLVDQSGDEVLADAGFTGHEDLRVRARSKLNFGPQGVGRCAAAYQGQIQRLKRHVSGLLAR